MTSKKPSILLAAALATVTGSALGCDCTERYLNTFNGKKQAVAVFTAMPVAKSGHFGDMLYTLRVESVWKGTIQKHAYLYGGRDSCAYAFRVGTMYLVFTHGGRGTAEDPAQTTVCASNKELGGASSDVKYLGKPVEIYDRLEKRPRPPSTTAAMPAPPPGLPPGAQMAPGPVPVAPLSINRPPLPANPATPTPNQPAPVRTPAVVESKPGPMVPPAPPPSQ